MDEYNDISIKWIGDKVQCPESNLADKNYSFYLGCELDDVEYEVGLGAIIKIDNVSYIGCIHYFFENHDCKILPNKYKVGIELYYKPKDLVNKLEKHFELHEDYEIIKKDTIVLIHFTVNAIKARCVLVYGLVDEDPQELLQEFIQTTKDPIYVCRFIASLKNDKFRLRGAVENEIEISDDEETNETEKTDQFTVTHLESEDSKILMKIKREKVKLPSELLSKLRLSDGKQSELKSPEDLIKSVNNSFKNLLVEGSLKDLNESNSSILEPVVVLNRVESNLNMSQDLNLRKSSRISTRRSSKLSETSEVSATPTRSSRRQTRKSYLEFYKSPKRIERMMKKNAEKSPVYSTRANKSKNFDDFVATPNKTIDFEDVSSSEKKVVRQKRSISFVPADVTPKKLPKVLQTPKSTRLVLRNMTPSIQERDEPIVFCDTPMSRARIGLSAYNLPQKLPCRESEYLNVYNFVSARIKDQSSGCMYISGVPGTGKTMTVCKVMSDMSEDKKEHGDFVFLKLNALALTEPRQIYVEIIKSLFNKKMHWEEALKEIIKFFKAKKKKIAHVILIDELDKLCNRKQDVVYNLLDLPFHSVTPLIVITIANTMDLPERILTNKVNSRLGLVRLTFKPYQYKDLVKIVTERLANDKVFKNEALELVARKVAAVSGDARRALAMCSRSTEIAEEEEKELITMDIVDRVVKEMSSSSKVQAIQSCSKLEQFILSSIASEVTRTGNEEVPFMNMLHNLEQLCILESFKLPAVEVCLRLCHNLGSFRLLITQHGRADIYMTLMLNISTDDIHYALRN